MRSILIVAIILGFCTAAQAAVEKNKGILVKVDFSFKDGERKVDTRSELIIADQNTDWMPLTSAKNGVVLLGKIDKLDKTSLTMHYMVVDTQTSPVSLNRMGVVASYNESAVIRTGNEHKSVRVNMVAQPTSYTETL